MSKAEPKRSSSRGFARFCFFVFAAFVVIASAFGQATAVRLAIVVHDVEAKQASDLLTVELSTRKDVQLLEREEIDRVYREQQIASANRNYLRLGQVLGADGLIVLESAKAGTNQSLSLSFISVKAGVVLSAERFSWSRTTAPDWAGGIVRHLSPLIPKAAVPAKDAVPISVVSVRSAIQSPEGRDLEHELTLLLNERLARQPELFVLERRRMQTLTSEKELQGVDDQPFWSGSFLLEGMLDPDGYSPEILTLRARLVPPRGGPAQTVEVSCSRTNPAAVIETLTLRLLAALRLQPSTEAWNTADEASQFFADADWAQRWGLSAQAQAASESAWALGMRTEPLAALRIRAYADAAFPVYLWSGNIVIPGLPDPALLQPLLRALELFNRNAPLSFTNGAHLSQKWFLNGLHLFRSAAATLDGFYHWAELVEAHAPELADTRSLTRELLKLLDNHPPMPVPELRRRLFVQMNHELNMFDLVKWNEGGLMFDRPEDSLPFFRSMLEEGYAASDLPRLVGWQWEQRKTLPKITREFLDDLCASTNAATRLGGLMLRMANTPFNPQITFHERESALANALWDYRQWVLSTIEHARVIRQTAEILRRAYGDADPNVHFTHEPFATMRYRLEKEFLLTSTNFDNQRFEVVFPRTYAQMPLEQAKDLAEAMQHLVGPRNFAYTIRDQLRARAGLAPLTTNAPPAVPVVPADELLTARFVRWHLPHCVPGPDQHLHCERLLFRRGRLWTMVAILPAFSNFNFSPPQLCVSIDPETGAGDEMPFPNHTDSPQNRFEVTKDALYVSFSDRLMRFQFAKHAWDKLQVPMETGAEMVALGDKLYLTTSDSILEVQPDTLATKILGSARRQPPANDLDVLLGATTYSYARRDGHLGIMGSKQFLDYDPTTQAWCPVRKIPPMRMGPFIVPFLFPEGALLRTTSIIKWQLLALWNDQATLELLLERPRPEVADRPPRGNLGPGNPLWEWPPGLDLDSARILTEGKSLLVLSPRKVWKNFGNQYEEAGRFSDARHATLFCFLTDRPTPVAIPIIFESCGVEPFNPRQGGFTFLDLPRIVEVPFWLDTPAGLAFSEPTLGGHWLIPRAALSSRLSAAGATAAATASQEHKAGSQTGTAKP